MEDRDCRELARNCSGISSQPAKKFGHCSAEASGLSTGGTDRDGVTGGKKEGVAQFKPQRAQRTQERELRHSPD